MRRNHFKKLLYVITRKYPIKYCYPQYLNPLYKLNNSERATPVLIFLFLTDDISVLSLGGVAYPGWDTENLIKEVKVSKDYPLENLTSENKNIIDILRWITNFSLFLSWKWDKEEIKVLCLFSFLFFFLTFSEYCANAKTFWKRFFTTHYF